MAHGDSIAFMKAKIKVLLRARLRIEKKLDPYICWALAYVMDTSRSRIENDAAFAMKRYIHNSLGGMSTLDSWIVYRRKGKNLLRDGYNADDVRQYRLQWIDWMVQDLHDQLAARQLS
jgi:hypothetical protein